MNKNQIQVDETDLQILSYLIEDSRLSHKELGVLVHMTGQAVGARIRRMQDNGVIEGYTIRYSPAALGQNLQAFVTVFLGSNTVHSAFQEFARNEPSVQEVFRISGEGCYWMRVRSADQEELNLLLDKLLKYGNYQVNLDIGQMK
ncbi:Lrp/AsnC family transcriptional regulator [Paenibacillus donghaensis]|uniref:Transcriptional regulator n=1 Tax=Paenibacillus donghaensis TaxID=414771 RepID=A0A2Z2K9I2_9BACL|nr:Lrp/AsnC family transcriptional regulator [Paenibacillus donghaensis]ASA19500.1 transcriptional regulator [Paenibacillus donghaensis]